MRIARMAINSGYLESTAELRISAFHWVVNISRLLLIGCISVAENIDLAHGDRSVVRGATDKKDRLLHLRARTGIKGAQGTNLHASI